MKGVKRSIWRTAAAQAAVFALLAQAMLSAFGCAANPPLGRGLSSAEWPGGLIVCVSQGVTPFAIAGKEGSDESPGRPPLHQDCPLCLSIGCSGSFLPAPSPAFLEVPVSITVAFAAETGHRPSSKEFAAFRNRGPPPLLQA
jgi:hypothetical protein